MADVQAELAGHQTVGIQRVVGLARLVGGLQQVAVVQGVDGVGHVPIVSQISGLRGAMPASVSQTVARS